MPAQINKIGILNRAAQLLGQPSISSLNENSRSARALIRAYDPVFLSEIEAHTWGFSIRRANLAADATFPINGRKRYYPLPPDFLFLAPEEVDFCPPKRRDYEEEIFNNTRCLVSALGSPLHIRFVSSALNESLFSATYAEAFACALSMATCEEITNSNTKLQNLSRFYDLAINRAKKRGDIQKAPKKSPVGSWIMARF
jgi:hypothetical protein